jgi:hypothetical protein
VVERTDHFAGGTIRAIGLTLAEVFEALCDLTIDGRLGDKNDLALLDGGFQQVAIVDPDLLAYITGNYNLILVFDGDQRHGGLPLQQSNGSTVLP